MKPLAITATFKILLAAILFLNACSQHSPETETAKKQNTNSEKIPSVATIQIIRTKFPHAVPYQQGIDSVLNHLKQYGIASEDILWGQSTCVDDIINTKNKIMPEIKGPFNFGGLAGLPFTGITGLNAFAHHVPDGGTALLFVGPHIGYNEKEGWGKILRHDQKHPSSCCGALVSALTKLQKGEIKAKLPSPDDYQEGVIEQLALTHKTEILSAPEPLISFTKLNYKEAIAEMTSYASKVKERHFKYAVIVGAIIINTDFRYTDYLAVETVAILDVQRNVWIQGEKPENMPSKMGKQ